MPGPPTPPTNAATGLPVVLRRPRRRYVSSPRLLKGGGGRRGRRGVSDAQLHLIITNASAWLPLPLGSGCLWNFQGETGVLFWFCLVLGITPFRAARWQRAWRPFARCARVMLERRPLCSLDAISQVHVVGSGNSFLLKLHPRLGLRAARKIEDGDIR